MTREGQVAMHAAHLLARKLARALGSDCADLLLTVALIQADEEVPPPIRRIYLMKYQWHVVKEGVQTDDL